MYAVIVSGGKQHRVEKGEVLTLENQAAPVTKSLLTKC